MIWVAWTLAVFFFCTTLAFARASYRFHVAAEFWKSLSERWEKLHAHEVHGRIRNRLEGPDMADGAVYFGASVSGRHFN